MKRRSVLIAAILFILGLFGIPVLLKSPALWPIFDYSKAHDLATAISGLTTPIISLISIILIYLAFIKQTEANKDLRTQTLNSQIQVQIEIINSVFDQINTEIDTYGHFRNKEQFTGRLAFYEVGDMVRNAVKRGDNLSLTNHTYGETLISVATLYSLIFKTIENNLLPL